MVLLILYLRIIVDSLEMKDISVALELVDAQRQLFSEFDSLLNIHNQPHFTDMHEKAKAITILVTKAPLQLWEPEKLDVSTLGTALVISRAVLCRPLQNGLNNFVEDMRFLAKSLLRCCRF